MTAGDEPLHVGLNLLYLLPGEVGGTETYARSLIGALDLLDGPEHYTLYVNRGAADLFRDAGLERCTVSVCDVDASRRAARYAFEQARLPRRVRADGVHVLHSLGYVGPLRAPCPHVVTIHDLIYRGFADSMPAAKRLVLRQFVRRTVRRADRVITVSATSRAAIVDDVGLAPEKVSVILEAPRADLTAATTSPEQDRVVLSRHGITPPYVVAFSSASPSKNIPTLLDSFSRLDDRAHQLVLIGHVPADGEVATAIERFDLADRVVTTGYVADEEVAPLVRNATVFAFPSRYEGFGLPLLEAQALGVPVAASNAASIPEVAGDGARYFDPASIDEMTATLDALLGDAGLRAEIVQRGHANVARFSWGRAASETRQVYRMLRERSS